VPSGTTDTLTSDDGSRLGIRSVDGVVDQLTRLPVDEHVVARVTR
jgi:hypothetical protein